MSLWAVNGPSPQFWKLIFLPSCSSSNVLSHLFHKYAVQKHCLVASEILCVRENVDVCWRVGPSMKVSVNLDKSVSKETDLRLDDLRLVPDSAGIYPQKKCTT